MLAIILESGHAVMPVETFDGYSPGNALVLKTPLKTTGLKSDLEKMRRIP